MVSTLRQRVVGPVISNFQTTSTSYQDIVGAQITLLSLDGSRLRAYLVAAQGGLSRLRLSRTTPSSPITSFLSLAIDGSVVREQGLAFNGDVSNQGWSLAVPVSELAFDDVYIIGGGMHSLKLQARLSASGQLFQCQYTKLVVEEWTD